MSDKFDILEFKNVNTTTVDNAIQNGLVSREFVDLILTETKRIWRILNQTIGENHVDEPSYIFLNNEDLAKLLNSPGEKMRLTYYYANTNSIFINIDADEYNFKSSGRDMYNLVANLTYPTLYYEPTVRGEMPVEGQIGFLPFYMRQSEDILRINQLQGKSFYLSLNEEFTMDDSEAEDSDEAYGYESYKLKEVMEILVMLIVGLSGEALYEKPLTQLKLITVFDNTDANQVFNFLTLDKERMKIWMLAVFKYLKFGKILNDDFKDLLKTDKEFKKLISWFIDPKQADNDVYNRLVDDLNRLREIKDISFERLSLNDKHDLVVYAKILGGPDQTKRSVLSPNEIKRIRRIAQSEKGFADIRLRINDSRIYSTNPINDILETMLYEAGLIGLCKHFLERNERSYDL